MVTLNTRTKTIILNALKREIEFLQWRLDNAVNDLNEINVNNPLYEHIIQEKETLINELNILKIDYTSISEDEK